MSLFILGGGQTNQTAGFINSISLDGNTAGVSSAGTGSVVFAGGNNVTLSAATAAGGETISIVGGAQTNSFWQIPYWGYASNKTYGNSQIQIFPIQERGFASFTKAHVLLTNSVSTSSNSSYSFNLSIGLALYTRSSAALNLASSGSAQYSGTISSDSWSSSWSAEKHVSIPITVNLTPGDYWLAFSSGTATTNANWISMSNVVFNGAITANDAGLFGGSTFTSQCAQLGFGNYRAASAAFPTSMSFSDISAGNVWNMVPIVFGANFTA